MPSSRELRALRPIAAEIQAVASLAPLDQAARVLDRELPAPAPELSFDGQLDLRGVSKVRARARTPLAIVAVVLIVLFIVAGAALIARSSGTPREDIGRCTERIERTPHTEYIERTCTRGGS